MNRILGIYVFFGKRRPEFTLTITESCLIPSQFLFSPTPFYFFYCVYIKEIRSVGQGLRNVVVGFLFASY